VTRISQAENFLACERRETNDASRTAAEEMAVVEAIGSFGIGAVEVPLLCECWNETLTACRCVKRPLRPFLWSRGLE
jgi:hypothetical protein